MNRNINKCRSEPKTQESATKKKNEALAMRCQISLTKMTQLMIDDIRFNGKDSAFADQILNISAVHADKFSKYNSKQKHVKSKKHEHFAHHYTKRSHHFNRGPFINEVKLNENHDEGKVLQSDAWFNFVGKNGLGSSSGGKLGSNKIHETPSSSFELFSRYERMSLDNAKSYNRKPVDPNPSLVCKSNFSDSLNNYDCDTTCPDIIEAKGHCETFKTNSVTNCEPTETEKLAESNEPVNNEILVDIDRMVAEKRLSKYTSPPPREYIPTSFKHQRSQLKGNPRNLLKLGIKNIWPPDCDRSNKDYSNVPSNYQGVHSTATLKYEQNASDIIDNSNMDMLEHNECFGSWLPNGSGEHLETVTHCGGEIAQYSFEGIHEHRPTVCSSSPSLCPTESPVISISRSCSSISFNTHSPRSDIRIDRIASCVDDFRNEQSNTEVRGKMDSAKYLTPAMSKHDVWGSDTSSASARIMHSKDIGDEEQIICDSGITGNVDNKKKLEVSEIPVIDVCCADLSNYESIFFSNVGTKRSSSDDTQQLSGPNKEDRINDGRFLQYNAATEGDKPVGYFRGISSHYVKPVVVPPPFPGRDRTNMVVKVKANEAKSGENQMVIKFKSNVKETTAKAHSENKEVNIVPIRTCRFNIKERETKPASKYLLKRQQTIQPLLYHNLDYKPPKKNHSSFVQRNIKSVTLPRLKSGSKDVLHLPVIDSGSLLDIETS